MIHYLRPAGREWRPLGRVQLESGPALVWQHESGVCCLSTVEMVEQNPPGSGIVAPHFHVSATWRGGLPRTCTDQEMEVVRAGFGLAGAEEGNHGAGIARHLWILVGRQREPECPCKQDEQRTVEGPRVRYDISEEDAATAADPRA